MSKYKRLAKNIFMLLAGNFVARIIGFFMVPLYTTILSTSDYGVADLVTNIVFIVLPIFSLLMEEAVMRFSLDKGENKEKIFYISLKLSTIGFLCFICISPVLFLFKNIKEYYWYIVVYYIVTWLYNLILNYIKGLDRIGMITIAGILHTFIYFTLNIFFLVVLKIGVHGYLLSIILSNFIVICFLAYSSGIHKKRFNFKTTDWVLAKKMVNYSTPMIPNYILWWINNAADRFLITFFCGIAINGIYSVAYKIPSLLSSVTAIFSSAWQISSVDDFGSEESINFYNKVYSFYSGILLIGGSILILFSKFLAYILYAKNFFEAWKITPILILAYIFSALAQYLNSIFSASKKTKKMMYSSFLGALVNIVLNLILIPKFLGIGAAIATLIGYMVIWTVNMQNTKTILKINFNSKRVIISVFFIILEIFFILKNYKQKYLISSMCIITVIILNRNTFYNMLNIFKLKCLKKYKTYIN